MLKITIAALLLTVGLGTVSVEPTPEAASVTGPESYEIDSSHTTMVFGITHMGVAKFWGRFNDIKGSIAWNEDQPSESSVSITIKTASVDSNDDKRDAHLKSPDFFDARQNPEITFKSTKVEKTDGGAYRVTGDLKLHGVTKSITMDVTQTGKGQTRQGFKIGFESRFSFKRSRFGMRKYMPKMLGDEIEVIMGIEAKRN